MTCFAVFICPFLKLCEIVKPVLQNFFSSRQLNYFYLNYEFLVITDDISHAVVKPFQNTGTLQENASSFKLVEFN